MSSRSRRSHEALQAGIGGLGAAQEFILIEIGGNVGSRLGGLSRLGLRFGTQAVPCAAALGVGLGVCRSILIVHVAGHFTFVAGIVLRTAEAAEHTHAEVHESAENDDIQKTAHHAAGHTVTAEQRTQHGTGKKAAEQTAEQPRIVAGHGCCAAVGAAGGKGSLTIDRRRTSLKRPGRRRGRTAHNGGTAETAPFAEAGGVREIRRGESQRGEAGGAEGKGFPLFHFFSS